MEEELEKEVEIQLQKFVRDVQQLLVFALEKRILVELEMVVVVDNSLEMEVVIGKEVEIEMQEFVRDVQQLLASLPLLLLLERLVLFEVDEIEMVVGIEIEYGVDKKVEMQEVVHM
eukprot:CAMPEP_0174820960 /NCGR_PEP_ID=MMETSP1107-20130205/5123_1 /TAXON_ID=36770 /ORGANISM="Paraphysomonas vestita, Strain GFlagA" /LENGTH=115 /DNA_ID=CAMNT_0016037307 /DNA_START=185 /DNA_END=532 /DNA_ORIENTATION=-